jgi:hypothetical protein
MDAEVAEKVDEAFAKSIRHHCSIHIGWSVRGLSREHNVNRAVLKKILLNQALRDDDFDPKSIKWPPARESGRLTEDFVLFIARLVGSGWSQGDVGELCGVSRDCIQGIVLGKRYKWLAPKLALLLGGKINRGSTALYSSDLVPFPEIGQLSTRDFLESFMGSYPFLKGLSRATGKSISEVYGLSGGVIPTKYAAESVDG